jgi:hypothetical protein
MEAKNQTRAQYMYIWKCHSEAIMYYITICHILIKTFDLKKTEWGLLGKRKKIRAMGVCVNIIKVYIRCMYENVTMKAIILYNLYMLIKKYSVLCKHKTNFRRSLAWKSILQWLVTENLCSEQVPSPFPFMYCHIV